MLFSALKRVTGIDLLQDLSEFFQSFGDMAEGFSERAQRVNDLLRRQPHHLPAGDRRPSASRDRRGDLLPPPAARARLPFGGVVVNRMNTLAVEGEDPDERELAELLGEELGLKVAGNLDEYEALAARDRQNVKRLTRELRGGSAPILVPNLEDDVHDIRGLIELNQYLFAAEAVPARLAADAHVGLGAQVALDLEQLVPAARVARHPDQARGQPSPAFTRRGPVIGVARPRLSASRRPSSRRGR